MKKKPVFVFVTHYLKGGGAERAIAVLASGLAEIGYETHIFVHYRLEDEYPVNSLVEVHYDRLYVENNRSIWERLDKLNRLRKYVKECRATYVIPFLDICTVHAYLATRFLNIKFISTIRVNPVTRTGKYARLSDFIVNYSTALYAQTSEEKAYYSRKVQNKTFVLPNPVNKKALGVDHTYTDNFLNIVAAGRLCEQKNYQMLINAIEWLRDNYEIKVNVFIYGEGELRNDLTHEINKRNLEKNIYLMGYTSNIIEAYNKSDIYVMTSNYEGMPNALMEAMAVGLPCISTDCPSGPSELIKDGENGLLVKVDDYITLAEKIKYYIDNPDKARRIGVAAKRTIADSYTPERIARRFLEECEKY